MFTFCPQFIRACRTVPVRDKLLSRATGNVVSRLGFLRHTRTLAVLVSIWSTNNASCGCGGAMLDHIYETPLSPHLIGGEVRHLLWTGWLRADDRLLGCFEVCLDPYVG